MVIVTVTLGGIMGYLRFTHKKITINHEMASILVNLIVKPEWGYKLKAGDLSVVLSNDNSHLELKLPYLKYKKKKEEVLALNDLSIGLDLSKIISSFSLEIVAGNMIINYDKIAQQIKDMPEPISIDNLYEIRNFLLENNSFNISKLEFGNILLKRNQKEFKGVIDYKKQDDQFSSSIWLDSKNIVKILGDKKSKKIELSLNDFPSWFVLQTLPDSLTTDVSIIAQEEMSVSGDITLSKKSKDPSIKFNLHYNSPGNTKIKSFNLQADDIGSELGLYLNNLQLELTSGSKFKASGSFIKNGKKFSTNSSIKANVEIENLYFTDLKYFWPKQLVDATRFWLTTQFLQGKVSRGKCDIQFDNLSQFKADALKAEVFFDDLKLSYHPDFYPLSELSGIAKFNLDKVEIDVEKGKIGSSNINKSLVKIEYAKEGAPIEIDANAKGKITDFLHLMGEGNLSKFKNNNLNLENISGDLSAKTNIKMLISEGFIFGKTQLTAQAKLSNLKWGVYSKILLDNGNIGFNINQSNFSLDGEVDVNKDKSILHWQTNFYDDKDFDNQLTLNSKISANSDFTKIFNDKLTIKAGKGDFALDYKTKKEKSVLKIKSELKNAELFIPAIGFTKKMGNDAALELSANKNDEAGDWNISGFNFLSKAQNFEFKAGGVVSNNLSSIKNLVLNAIYEASNLIVIYDEKPNSNQNLLRIFSDKIDLSKANLLDIFTGDNFLNGEVSEKKTPTKPMNFEIDVKEAIGNNGIVFSKLKGKISCSAKFCNQGKISANLPNKNIVELNVTKPLEGDGADWVLTASNAEYLLKGLGVYNDIENGALKLTFRKQPKISQGELEILKFNATKTPILAKLVSLSSFLGVMNIFGSANKIPFDKFEADFTMSADELLIKEAYATGGYLTLLFGGEMDLSKKTLDLKGKVIPPVYGINYVLSLVPIIGGGLTSGKGKGLIAAGFSVKGEFGKTKVSVNPLRMLLPSGIGDAVGKK
jgi:hypothetical protein